jgi:hypothetical protein
MWRKVYVNVLAEHHVDGSVWPRVMLWVDGCEYPIDRIVNSKPCAATKAGGHGIRYELLIRGQMRYLFREDDKWFVEYAGPIDEGDGA